MKKFRITGISIETNKPYKSAWCNCNKVKIKNEYVIISIEFMKVQEMLANMVLKDWQLEYKN